MERGHQDDKLAITFAECGMVRSLVCASFVLIKDESTFARSLVFRERERLETERDGRGRTVRSSRGECVNGWLLFVGGCLSLVIALCVFVYLSRRSSSSYGVDSYSCIEYTQQCVFLRERFI